MDLLEDLKMSLLNFNFVLIYIIHKMVVLSKNQLNYLKDSIFECFFKEKPFFKRKKNFFTTYKEKIIKDIRIFLD